MYICYLNVDDYSEPIMIHGRHPSDWGYLLQLSLALQKASHPALLDSGPPVHLSKNKRVPHWAYAAIAATDLGVYISLHFPHMRCIEVCQPRLLSLIEASRRLLFSFSRAYILARLRTFGALHRHVRFRAEETVSMR